MFFVDPKMYCAEDEFGGAEGFRPDGSGALGILPEDLGHIDRNEESRRRRL